MDSPNNNNNNNNINNISYETNIGLEIFNNLLNATESTQPPSQIDNICISPFLLEALLALLYLGSDGKTAEELKNKLKRFPNNAKMANYFAGNLALLTQDSTDTQLEICSKILVNENYELDGEFKKIAQKYFLTLAEQVQFSDTPSVSYSIQKNIQANLGKSTNYLPAENSKSLAMMATNFKNKWFLPFSAYRSGLYDFHLAPDSIKAVPMMLDNEMFVKFVELKELDCRAVELPYEHDDELSMLIILPNKRDGLQDLELQLKDINLNLLSEKMQMESVQLLLPKFRIDFECCLKTILEKMGLSIIFTDDSNFKNLLSAKSTSKALPISDIFHKACIDVNESGSETSNVEASKPIIISNSIDTRQKFFRADHPFFFAIRNREATFFIGHVGKF